MSEPATAPPPPTGTRLARALGASFGRVLDVALPRLCPICRERVAAEGLCGGCWSQLTFIARPYCERLGIPFPYDPGPGVLSLEALSEPPAYHRARAAVQFDDIARRLVHALKYGDRADLAPLLGRWMAHAGGDLLSGADALVPVPLHWRRLWARRFNQSAALAQVVATATGLPVSGGLLRRVRATPHQVGLSRTARATNMQGAFRVPTEAAHLVTGRNLILVDDVLTTGATAEACARALTRAGAARVDVLVLARVVAPLRAHI